MDLVEAQVETKRGATHVELRLPTVLGSEKGHRNVLRVFSDVSSAVFDGYHHLRRTGSEYGA